MAKKPIRENAFTTPLHLLGHHWHLCLRRQHERRVLLVVARLVDKQEKGRRAQVRAFHGGERGLLVERNRTAIEGQKGRVAVAQLLEVGQRRMADRSQLGLRERVRGGICRLLVVAAKRKRLGRAQQARCMNHVILYHGA